MALRTEDVWDFRAGILASTLTKTRRPRDKVRLIAEALRNAYQTGRQELAHDLRDLIQAKLDD